jgi:hypothetical protein
MKVGSSRLRKTRTLVLLDPMGSLVGVVVSKESADESSWVIIFTSKVTCEKALALADARITSFQMFFSVVLKY